MAADRGRPGPAANWLLVLAFVHLCVVSLFTYLPQVLHQVSAGTVARMPRLGDLEFYLFRVPREALYVVLLGCVVFGFARGGGPRLTRTTLALLVGAVTWVAICFAHTVFVRELPPVVPLLGLKSFQASLYLAAGVLLAWRGGDALLLRFADWLRWYVLVIVVTGLAQVPFGAGKSTVFGVRALGPFSNYNAFGGALFACALWFLCARIARHRVDASWRYLGWILLCAATSLTTGSRAGIIVNLLVVAAAWFVRFRGRWLRILWIALSALMVAILPFLLTNRALTGKDPIRSSEKRLEAALEVVDRLSEPSAFVFGGGLGLFSKAPVVLFGRDAFPGQMGGPYSTYLEVAGSFGVPGLLAFLAFMAVSVVRGRRPEALLTVGIVGIYGVQSNLCSNFPVDGLVLLLWGHLLFGPGDPKTGVEHAAT